VILVLLGTFVTDFKRPLVEIERLCEEGVISEEVIVQSGHTIMDNCRHIKMRQFIKPDDLADLQQRASIIITHAGATSIISAIKLRKKVIGIARLSKYNEHVDDHQLEILEQLSKLNYILAWHDGVPLATILSQVEDFVPTEFVSDKSRMINYLTEYINSL
jgi:UDP-N-acetylglucosamine transferase subunit ALG13